MQAITIGLDLAKHWFQVHGVDAAGKIVVKRRLRRAEVIEFFRGQEPCLVGMEACATAHYWARELIKLGQWHRSNRISKLLATVPGVGIMGASAIAATVSDPSLFRSGREFAAWLGMTPRQNSSGGKERLGRTSKRGDKYIRGLLVAGAVAVLRHARERATKDGQWVRDMLARKPAKLVAVALANRTARIVWAVMARGDGYQAKPPAKEIVGQAA